MRNEIIEKAQELGQMIAKCEESTRVKETGDKMNADEAAVELLQSYNDNRRIASDKLRNAENPSKEEIEEFKAYAESEFERIAKNPLIADYIEASRELDNLVQQVNAVLSYFIKGARDGESNCSGDCSSCSSCH
ncbi:MAG: YlbF family regulator [Clostridia bacterium]|nr:YlbF family regulator [Clostridia bacterium]